MSVELPRYKCHKEVTALKIKNVIVHAPPEGEECTGGFLLFESPYPAIAVDRKFLDFHDPQAGGYWVQYRDGYQDYVPAEAFEYRRVWYRLIDQP